MKASGYSYVPASWRILGHNVDNSPTFTSASRPTYRMSQATTARVDWRPPPWYNLQWNASPNIASIIQEIVNRPGWEPHHALALLVVDNGSTSGVGRNVFGFDANPRNPMDAAYLVVTYGTTPVTPTHTPTPGPTPTTTPSPTVTSTPTSSATPTSTFTPTPTASVTATPSMTPTPSTTPTPSQGGVRGFVFCGSYPLEGVSVYAQGPRPSTKYTLLGITGPVGDYDSGLILVPGSYRLVATKSGYVFKPTSAYVQVEAGETAIQNFSCY